MSCSVCLNKEVQGWVSNVRVTRPSISSLYAVLHLVFAIFGVRCCQLCTGCGDSLQTEWVTKTVRKGQLPLRLDVPAFFVWSAWFQIWICTFHFTNLYDWKMLRFQNAFFKNEQRMFASLTERWWKHCLAFLFLFWLYSLFHMHFIFIFSVHHLWSSVSICCSLCTPGPYTRDWMGVLSYSICCAAYTLCFAQCQPLFPNEHENSSQALLFRLGGLRKFCFETDNMIIWFCTNLWSLDTSIRGCMVLMHGRNTDINFLNTLLAQVVMLIISFVICILVLN